MVNGKGTNAIIPLMNGWAQYANGNDLNATPYALKVTRVGSDNRFDGGSYWVAVDKPTYNAAVIGCMIKL